MMRLHAGQAAGRRSLIAKRKHSNAENGTPSHSLCYGQARPIRRRLLRCSVKLWKPAALLVIFALLSVRAFGEFVGDPELMRLIAEADRANREKILTWQGSASIRSSYLPADTAENRLQLQSEISVQFSYNRALRAKRWDVSVLRHGRSDGTAQISKRSRGLLLEDTLYRIGPYLATEDDRRQPCHIYDASEPYRQTLDLSDGAFDPFSYFSPSPINYQNRYESLKESTGREGGGLRRLTRNADLIIYETVLGDNVNIYTFDVSQGCNLVKLYGEGPSSAPYEWSCQYEEIEGIWLPKRITIEQGPRDDRGASPLTDIIVFTHDLLNAPIAESHFSLESLGIAPGTAIFDERIKRQYPYEPAPDGSRSTSAIDLHDLGLALVEDGAVSETALQSPAAAEAATRSEAKRTKDEVAERTAVLPPALLLGLTAAVAGAVFIVSIWVINKRRTTAHVP